MTNQDGQRHRAALPEVALRVREIVAESLEHGVDEVHLDSSLFALGAESLDMVDMAFTLENEYQIQFPRTDILERLTQSLDASELVDDGVITDLGLDLLRKGMPELDPDVIKPGLRDIDVAQMITVGSFARITQRLLDAKTELSRDCPKCAGTLVESEVMPEFECPDCGGYVPLPSGDEILLTDLMELYREAQEQE
jgi:acyl carrier protein